MDNKNNFSSLQDFFDWIDKNPINCYVAENDKHYFIIETPNSTDIIIQYQGDEKSEKIVSRTIEILLEFNAEKKFVELKDSDFVKKNRFSDEIFLKMLKSDEKTFHELAEEIIRVKN
jgi:hypothetical protein